MAFQKVDKHIYNLWCNSQNVILLSGDEGNRLDNRVKGTICNDLHRVIGRLTPNWYNIPNDYEDSLKHTLRSKNEVHSEHPTAPRGAA